MVNIERISQEPRFFTNLLEKSLQWGQAYCDPYSPRTLLAVILFKMKLYNLLVFFKNF